MKVPILSVLLIKNLSAFTRLNENLQIILPTSYRLLKLLIFFQLKNRHFHLRLIKIMENEFADIEGQKLI